MDAVDAGLSLVFPGAPACPLCGHTGTDRRAGWAAGLGYYFGMHRGEGLCTTCLRTVRELVEPLCRICGRPGQGPLCHDCRKEAHVFFEARAFASYEGAVEQAIKDLKYQGNRKLIPILGEWLTEAYMRFYGDAYVTIVPVPMHPSKLAQRGFNHAEELARHLGRRIGAPVCSLLARVTDGSSQTAHTRTERLEGLHDAFVYGVASPARQSLGSRLGRASLARRGAQGSWAFDRTHYGYHGRPVAAYAAPYMLLVDDVFTTGGTADACARLLFAHGAASVRVLTVAR